MGDLASGWEFNAYFVQNKVFLNIDRYLPLPTEPSYRRMWGYLSLFTLVRSFAGKIIMFGCRSIFVLCFYFCWSEVD